MSEEEEKTDQSESHSKEIGIMDEKPSVDPKLELRKLEEEIQKMKKVNAAINKLKARYEGHKQLLAPMRYMHLKSIIKSAIKYFEEEGTGTKDQPETGGVQESEGNEHNLANIVELHEAIKQCQIEIAEMRSEYERNQRNLKELYEQYIYSRVFDPNVRYKKLKKMIKDCIRNDQRP